MAHGWCYAITTTGTLTGQERWTVGDSPVKVRGELRIAPDASLLIEPGVTVIVSPSPQAPGRIVVEGELRAIGTQREPILFRGEREEVEIPDVNEPQALRQLKGWEQWEGVVLVDKAKGANEDGSQGCAFKFCVFRHASKPITAGASPLFISYCSFEAVGTLKGGGLAPSPDDFAVTLREGWVEYCRFNGSGAGALRCGGKVIVSYCLFQNGFGDAVACTGDDWLQNCAIRDFRGFALSGAGDAYDLIHSTISNCATLAALPNDAGKFPTIRLENCDILDMGRGKGWGAIHIRTRAKDGTKLLRIETQGEENRVVSDVSISDAPGGHEILFPNAWWGAVKPNVKDTTRFKGQRTKFSLHPLLTKDPNLLCLTHEGLVLDADGNPVPDAMVWAVDSQAAPTTSDAEGKFFLQGSLPGVYHLYAYVPGLGIAKAVADWGFSGDVVNTMNRPVTGISEPLKLLFPKSLH